MHGRANSHHLHKNAINNTPPSSPIICIGAASTSTIAGDCPARQELAPHPHRARDLCGIPNRPVRGQSSSLNRDHPLRKIWQVLTVRRQGRPRMTKQIDPVRQRRLRDRGFLGAAVCCATRSRRPIYFDPLGPAATPKIRGPFRDAQRANVTAKRSYFARQVTSIGGIKQLNAADHRPGGKSTGQPVNPR